MEQAVLYAKDVVLLTINHVFSEKTQYSMEGSGIDVVRMAIDHKMTYNAGRGKVGYFTLVLYNA